MQGQSCLSEGSASYSDRNVIRVCDRKLVHYPRSQGINTEHKKNVDGGRRFCGGATAGNIQDNDIYKFQRTKEERKRGGGELEWQP